MRTRLGPFSIDRARRLRRESTWFELKLWWKLKELRQLGYHFRRQAPFRSYILDFVEHNHRVVIELDGEQHGLPENSKLDVVRDRDLIGEGYIVMRFWNNEITENLDGVVEGVLGVLRDRPPTRIATRSVDTLMLSTPTRGRQG
jgi:very-short-patch-repair endonuclease